MAIKKLSYSRLDRYTRCGEAYRRTYVCGEYLLPSVPMLIGSALDEAASECLVEKSLTGELADVESMRRTAINTFREAWRGGVDLKKEWAQLGPVKAQVVAEQAVVRLVAFFRERVAPGARPRKGGVQRPFALTVAGTDYEIPGFIDWEEDDPVSINDLKFTDSDPKPDSADKSMQLRLYALGKLQVDGVLPTRGVLHYIYGHSQPRYIPIETEITEAQLAPIVHRMEQAMRGLDAGLYLPAPPGAWWCSKANCDFFATCNFAMKGTNGK